MPPIYTACMSGREGNCGKKIYSWFLTSNSIPMYNSNKIDMSLAKAASDVNYELATISWIAIFLSCYSSICSEGGRTTVWR